MLLLSLILQMENIGIPERLSGLQTITQPVYGRADLNLGNLASEFVDSFSTLFWKLWAWLSRNSGKGRSHQQCHCLEAKIRAESCSLGFWHLPLMRTCLLLWSSKKTGLNRLRAYGEIEQMQTASGDDAVQRSVWEGEESRVSRVGEF